MSIKIMTMVFDRYPKGGGEMLLALSLADFADDNGESIFPSIKQLAEKTRQSERTVQYQLRRMEKSGWLVLVNSGNGGRNQRREYVINPKWIKGAEIAPIEKGANHDTKGATDDTKGCNLRHKRVQRVAPAYNHHRTTIEPSKNHHSAREPKTADRFEEFWQAYPNTPRRVAKKKCRERWRSRKLDGIADEIVAHVMAMKNTQQWMDGYEPAPMTYLNQSRWEDGIPQERPSLKANQNQSRSERYRAEAEQIHAMAEWADREILKQSDSLVVIE